MPALEEKADFVRKTAGSARRAGVRLGTVLLDREFFATGAISALKGAGVKYLMPCRNTGGVAGAIGEFAVGSRGREPRAVLSGGGRRGRDVHPDHNRQEK